MAYIKSNISEDYKNITKVTLIDVKKVYYPIAKALGNGDITYDEDGALVFEIKSEDLEPQLSAKTTDSGQVFDITVKIDVNNQLRATETALKSFLNKNVIAVFHYSHGKIILGCNEQPLRYSYSEVTSTSPSSTNGFVVDCRGRTYFSKVSL